LARRGRVRAHVHVRRRRARLYRGAEDPGDHLPARGQVHGLLHRRPDRPRAAPDSAGLPGLVHRHPAGRLGHGPGVRPPAGRQVRHEAALRARRVGDLLPPPPARPAVQAGPAAHPGPVRRAARPGRGGHRRGAERCGQRTAGPMTEPAVRGPDEAISIDLLTDPAGVPRARAMLQRAQWAGSAFARYDRPAVDRIVHAAAAAGAAQAREYADWAVRETGFGVAEHKVIKNLASSTGLLEAYAGHDYVTPRVDPSARMVEIPRPA